MASILFCGKAIGGFDGVRTLPIIELWILSSLLKVMCPLITYVVPEGEAEASLVFQLDRRGARSLPASR